MNTKTDIVNTTDFIIHYDTGDNHEISSDVFIASIKLLENILKATPQQTSYKSNRHFKIIIKIPEEGGFIQNVVISIGVIITFLEMDIGKSFYKGLTGSLPAEHSEQIGEIARNYLTLIISTPNQKIKTIELPVNLKNKIIANKSNFYRTCLKDENVKAIGFDKSHKFPIQRKDFYNHIEPDSSKDTYYENYLYEVLLISPVEDGSKIVWGLRSTKTGKTIKAYMKDVSFQNRCLSGMNPFKATKKTDVMTILIRKKFEIIDGEVKEKSKTIEKVYKFNDEILESIPTNIEFE